MRPLVGVGLELADVVQQRAGDRDVAVDARERGADRAHRLGDAEAVLEQPVSVGLVVVLGGGRDAVAAHSSRALAEHALEQRAQVRLLDGARAARAARASICSTARAGPSSRSSWS